MNQPARLVIPAFGVIYAALTPITEALIRVVAGGSLAIHGYLILFGGIATAAKFFESVGFENGVLCAYGVGGMEFICGIALAIGFLTRVAAAPIIGFLAMAIATYHWQFGFSWENRGIEYPLFWAIVVFNFLVRGGGRWSLDALIGREI